MSRNAQGQYTLPPGNPVVAGTLIESDWANTTMSDMGTALTDSLDRTGKGSMIAPLKAADGSAPLPSITFAVETTMGLYRAGVSQMGVSVLGQQVALFQQGAVTIPATAEFGCAGLATLANVDIQGGEGDFTVGLKRQGLDVAQLGVDGLVLPSQLPPTSSTVQLNVEQQWLATQSVWFAVTGIGAAPIAITPTPVLDGQVAYYNLVGAGAVTINAPTGAKQGAFYTFVFNATDTNVRTFVWNSFFKFPGGVATLTSGSTTVGGKDIITFWCSPGALSFVYVGHVADVR
jgi:hypothetical protein